MAMMVQELNLVCGTTVGKKKVSSSRAKVSFAAWVFIFWVCLKSIYVMYKLVNDTEAAIAAEDLKQPLSSDSSSPQLDDDTDVLKVAWLSFAHFNEYVGKSETLCWVMLLASIFTETAATTVSKYASDNSSATLLALACFMVILSQCGLTVSLAQIDVGVAYAMWAAIGTATVSFCAMFLFAEEFDLIKVGCLLMIIVGVAGLNLREEH